MPRFIRQFGQPRLENAPKNNLKDFWLPLGPIVVALAAIFAQMFTNFQNQRLQLRQMELQTQLKQYELSFKPKQEAYTAFMKAADEYCGSSNAQADANFEKLKATFYGLEPFLDSGNRQRVVNYMRGMNAAYPLGSEIPDDPNLERCSDILANLRERLVPSLFPNLHIQ